MQLEIKDDSVHKIQVVHRSNQKIKRDTLKYNVYISKHMGCFDIHLQVTINANSGEDSYKPNSMYTIFFCQTNRYIWPEGISSDVVSELAVNEGINDTLEYARDTLVQLQHMIGLRKTPETKYKLTELMQDDLEENLSNETIRFSNSFFDDSATSAQTFSG